MSCFTFASRAFATGTLKRAVTRSSLALAVCAASTAQAAYKCDVVGPWLDSNDIMLTMVSNKHGTFPTNVPCPAKKPPGVYEVTVAKLTTRAWNFKAVAKGCPEVTATLTWESPSYPCDDAAGIVQNATGTITIKGMGTQEDTLSFVGGAKAAHHAPVSPVSLDGLRQ